MLKNIVFFGMAVFTLEAGPKWLTPPKRVRYASFLLASKPCINTIWLCQTWGIFSRPSVVLLWMGWQPLASCAGSGICLFISPV